jgi:hypothetical protein
MSNLFNDFCKIVFGLVVFFLTSSNVQAKTCEGDTNHNTQIGDVVEFKQKVKINSICSRTLHKNNVTFLESEMIDYPKGIFQVVERPYEFAFRVTKTGKYIVKYRYKVQDKFGKSGFINYIMYVEVVDNEW